MEVDLTMKRKWIYFSIAIFAAGAVWATMYFLQESPAEEPGRTVEKSVEPLRHSAREVSKVMERAIGERQELIEEGKKSGIADERAVKHAQRNLDRLSTSPQDALAHAREKHRLIEEQLKDASDKGDRERLEHRRALIEKAISRLESIVEAP